jgi:ABC-2 type transport system permease protein
VLSFIPFLTPSMMIMRIPILMPPAWEIAATLGIMTLSVIGMIWVAGKIFRVGILLTGKRPSLDEIVRWIRSK